MILLTTGTLFIALGLLAGAFLVIAPFGLVSLEPGLALWILFPGLSIVGYALVIVGAGVPQIRSLSLVASCLLLVLALASAAGLVFSAVSVTPPVTGTATLWFVLVVAGGLGTIGVASHNRPQSDD